MFITFSTISNQDRLLDPKCL